MLLWYSRIAQAFQFSCISGIKGGKSGVPLVLECFSLSSLSVWFLNDIVLFIITAK